MYVCRYACMRVCMYACMYACIHVCMYLFCSDLPRLKFKSAAARNYRKKLSFCARGDLTVLFTETHLAKLLWWMEL